MIDLITRTSFSYGNMIAYCQQNRYLQLAIEIDLFTLMLNVLVYVVSSQIAETL